ncbi:MAG: Cell division inhibitor [uncultured Solirubrobacteraceae bacterium]|uniref:Cell division inhibitor n=1 Tax=uncultured Solirubrobacteraceae bacterium TaxID=1162706 RepID=A0A6J4RPZ8_9ACTN|nr:MAG: Cell division inhibitor [uncultured Solirubrobacteraceae bacterium]
MRVTITGATGLIGSALVDALRQRGDEVTVLSRDPDRAREKFGGGVLAFAWEPEGAPVPAEALAGRDGVVHLAGENIAQRWTKAAKRRIVESRERGTRNVVDGLAAADPRPPVLVSASGVGYYGFRGDEPLDEQATLGSDFLASVVAVWEREADRASASGVRVVKLRNGVVLDAHGGALSKMLPPFKAGVGGPVAGGRQYLPWIHLDDVVGMILQALGDENWSGAINATAPVPVSNAEFSKALGRALHRPAVAPVPALALRALYGEMADLVVHGQRALPRRALELGYAFRHPDLDEALRSALRD